MNCTELDDESDGVTTEDSQGFLDANYEQCAYDCQTTGGCNVQYTGPPRGGPSAGSCFPPLFGSSCLGTPPECQDCNKVLDCSEATETATEITNDDEPPQDVCDYQCQESGGCQVTYQGPPRAGNTFGSCFPLLFGGTCSGTPDECQDCNQVIQCEEEGPEYEDYEDGEEGEAYIDELVNPDGEPCIYLCNDDGGCTVRYAGPPQSGSTVGNCFSSLFGGSCSGIPNGCRDCNKVLECKRRRKSGNESRPGIPEYCEITDTHTMCQFEPGTSSDRCGKVLTHKITDQIKQRLLDHHNKLRRKVANGEEPDQPSAANMRELEWNDELSDISQTWADQCDCIFHETNVYPCFHEHGGGKERAPLNKHASGQNLAWQSLPTASRVQDWTGRAQGWYDEVYDFNATFVDGWQPSNESVIGHYTQFVWGETYQMGCGILISQV